MRRAPGPSCTTVTRPRTTTSRPNTTSPAHLQALGGHQRRRALREARLEVVQQLEVRRVEHRHRRPGALGRPRRGQHDLRVLGEHVGVGAQHEQVVRGLDRREAPPRDAQRPRALEHVDRRAHRGLQLDHRGRRRVGRVHRLAVDDHRQAEDALAAGQQAGQGAQVDPQRVRVEEAVARDVLEGVRVLVGRLGDLAQHQAAGAPAREVTALAVGLGALGDLHDERDLLARDPAEDPRVQHGAEVVGVRDERPAIVALQQCVQEPGGDERRVEVAVAGRRPLQARDRPATRRARSRRRAAWGPCSGRSPAGRRPPGRGGGPARRSESSRVAKLFMSTSGRRAPERSRSPRTCRAMTSRKVRPSLTSSRDLARVIPMLVPSPPLSLRTTARSSAARPSSPASGRSSAQGASATGSISASGSTPVSPSRSRR